MVGRTTFIIAQRVSTVQSADLIIILERGEIVGTGTHEELLETNEIYAEVYRLQLVDETVIETLGLEAVEPAGVGERAWSLDGRRSVDGRWPSDGERRGGGVRGRGGRPDLTPGDGELRERR
jgi:ABC-type multidrug transport system ATPase subunit